MASQISEASTHYLQYDISWATIALLYYDWALTFPSEVQYVWGAKFSLSTLFYIFCRYALLDNVLYLAAVSNLLAPSTSVTCDNWKKFVSALSVGGRAAIVATLIGRAYAVSSRNRLILGYLIALGIVCVVADAFHVPSERCIDSTDPPLATLLRSLFTIAFETSVAIVTTVRTLQALSVGGNWKTQKHRIVYLIFEEGILYFCTISILTIASVILDLRAPTGFLQRLLDGLTLPLSGALTARFILHLRAWQNKQQNVHFITTVQEPGSSEENLTVQQNHSWIVDEEANVVRSLSSTLNEFGEDPVVRAKQESGAGTILVQVDSQTHKEDLGEFDRRSSNPVDFY
ncbi:hypothetical protein GYMLUDRAFT_42360 [Collybiopsis luxurians FD-317 M1]|uniref:DUF6533 domain-containing protein n=1 Tax=Collybiopsis luxurians FD-317 M1 TaxID=944289 RepID=A0A0D0CZG5_9AGAR|nr:hypothetical protein GYMLUDRAFT_42360 [Collybiopsis luxurians FD-317 M1]